VEEMRLGKTILILLMALTLVNPVFAESEKEKDFAVPAFSDFQLLASQNQTPNANLDPLPMVSQIRWLDLNRDRELNDVDTKQFESIIESLRGEKLTGLQLSLRFKSEQKNQRESFPLLYDLDRDGMFTAFDVDAFTEVVRRLDAGADRGTELVQKFNNQLLPQEKK
jgi:hypothetical protein